MTSAEEAAHSFDPRATLRWLQRSCFFFLWPGYASCASAYEAPITYLTLGEDPLHQMQVCWIVPEGGEEPSLSYKREGEEEWKHCPATSVATPSGGLRLNKALLRGLTLDTVYLFRTSTEPEISRSFKTLPDPSSQPLSFLSGGDAYHDEVTDLLPLHRTAAALSPSFVLLGGDIAYSASRFSFFGEEANRWLEFLSIWQKTMVTPEGRMIPLLCAIGNHDVAGRFGQTPSQAQWFYALFGRAEKTLDFGNLLTLLLLDTNHTTPIAGGQTERLKSSLSARPTAIWKCACYHVPAYPVVRRLGSGQTPEIHKHWVPLFEQFGLDLAFENHDHAYKRTHKLKGGVVDERGVTYLGDGAWGVHRPRKPQAMHRKPYLAASAQRQHFLLVAMTEEKASVTAYDQKGAMIDYVELTPRQKAASKESTSSESEKVSSQPAMAEHA